MTGEHKQALAQRAWWVGYSRGVERLLRGAQVPYVVYARQRWIAKHGFAANTTVWVSEWIKTVPYAGIVLQCVPSMSLSAAVERLTRIRESPELQDAIVVAFDMFDELDERRCYAVSKLVEVT